MDNFKVLFFKGDDRLFMNPHLHYTINSVIESQASLTALMKEISEINLLEKYPDALEVLSRLKDEEPENEEVKEDGTKLIQSILLEEHNRFMGNNTKEKV
jgi:hypothetical protein